MKELSLWWKRVRTGGVLAGSSYYDVVAPGPQTPNPKP
jgi:hypothetical protein